MISKKTQDLKPSDEDESQNTEVWESLIKSGHFIPTTADEVELMEDILDRNKEYFDFPLPTVSAVAKCSGQNNSVDQSIDIENRNSSNYAIAARKGNQISESARAKMQKLKNQKS